MIIFKNTDSIKCNKEHISIIINGELIKFALSEINKVSVLTTDKGPFEDDVALAIFFNREVYILKSEHPMYSGFVFDELGKVVSLDYQEIINASTCTENAEFILYKGDDNS